MNKILITEIKWNLYRKHKKALDLAMEGKDIIEEDKGEYFAEIFYSKVLNKYDRDSCNFQILYAFMIGWTIIMRTSYHPFWPIMVYRY